MDEDRAKVLVREYQKLAGDFGQERFDAAVGRIIREGGYKFFPSVSEFLAYVPTGEARRYCGKCAEGFRIVPDFKANQLYSQQGHTMAVFCECRNV